MKLRGVQVNKMKRETFKKQRYWSIWIGKVTAAFFILYGFIKPDLVYVIGGVTVGILTLLHQKATRRQG